METIEYTTPATITLERLLDELKTAREHAQGLRDERRQMIEEVQATAAYKALSEAGAEADETVAEYEADIRIRAVNIYSASIKLPERVTVKKFTVVHIPSELSAKTWCIDNFTPALKLDVKAFEDAAKKGNVPEVLATVSAEFRAQIATKL